MLTGGCYCGEIRYEAEGPPFHETNCHCSICRRTTGAPFVAWFTVRRAGFRFSKGEPRRFNSTSVGVRAFCPTCGAQLTFVHADFPQEIDVTIASLDAPGQVVPKDNTHTGSRLPWVLPDTLPDFAEGRS
jgi:hypothetical protein